MDLGWRHLAYAKLNVEKDSFEILEWDVISLLDDAVEVNLNKISLEELLKMTSKQLISTVNEWSLGDMKPEYVYLESQPLGQMACNVKTKTLSHIIQILFLSHEIDVKFISPRKKLEGMIGKSSYADNKKFAVERVKELLVGNEHLEKFLTHKGKKDDLADAFLQGLFAAREQMIVKPEPKPKKKRKRSDIQEKIQSAIEMQV